MVYKLKERGIDSIQLQSRKDLYLKKCLLTFSKWQIPKNVGNDKQFCSQGKLANKARKVF